MPYDLIDNSVSIERMSLEDINYFESVTSHKPFYLMIKRLLDLFFVVLLAIPVLIIVLFFGILVKLDSKGPMIFKHKRIGKDMKPFEAYKLRSMYLIDGPEVTFHDDIRITRVGKIIRRFRIDELPQMFNVFLGQMSFIGPRPLAPKEYSDSHILFQKRTMVKPGISGLAQVNGGSEIDNLTKLKFDTYYIENISLLLDIKVFLKTFMVIFSGDGSR